MHHPGLRLGVAGRLWSPAGHPALAARGTPMRGGLFPGSQRQSTSSTCRVHRTQLERIHKCLTYNAACTAHSQKPSPGRSPVSSAQGHVGPHGTISSLQVPGSFPPPSRGECSPSSGGGGLGNIRGVHTLPTHSPRLSFCPGHCCTLTPGPSPAAPRETALLASLPGLEPRPPARPWRLLVLQGVLAASGPQRAQ